MTIPKPLRRALTKGSTWVFGAPNAESMSAIAALVGEVRAFSLDHRDTFATRGAWPASGTTARLDSEGAQYAQAVVFLPKTRARQRLSFAMAASVLASDGVLHVVGGKRDGIKPARKSVAEFFGRQRGVGAGDHMQCITVSDPLEAPGLDTFCSTVSLTLPDASTLEVCWYPGVFGMGKLDAGTRLLLQQLAKPSFPRLDGRRVLDVGCGSGVLGAWLARQGATVDMVDVDMLAVAASQQTLRCNGLEARVLPSDGLRDLAPKERYALVVSNPPFHQGAATDYDVARGVIQASRQHLSNRGRLVLVANRFLPYRDTLDETFGTHEVLAEDGRFRVYQAQAAEA